MIKALSICLLLFLEFSINDAAKVAASDDQKFALRGRVTFPKGKPPPIERGAKLYVELQDTSLQDAAATTVAKTLVPRVKKFPVSFTLRYTAKDVANATKHRNQGKGLPGSAASNTYSMQVSIKSKDGKTLLFTNDMKIHVKPLGNDRTKTIDVPVIAVQKSSPSTSDKGKTGGSKILQFPEVVGKNVDEAIKIIKGKTGFKDVVGLKVGTPVTYDLRNDRVRVFYNDKKVVTEVPMVA